MRKRPSKLPQKISIACPACGVSKQETLDLLNEAASALEFCLACDGKLTWEAEQEASAICTKIRRCV